ncbi:M23 family metallopeptidase [Paraneptunicella aestuarii]|uniref:M23 family metallopeptidase n=1 Tax=Paraneptunicella aestuarii TaxID=2831148 RepID=UPI001E4A4832|nr:M23 family metallopeptidase [Paraneptunicella aestuarii]UAA40750.1 M23 family metallopeptidase [Paraneptunicella aestuarii]
MSEIEKMLPSQPALHWPQLELRGQLKQGALLRGQIAKAESGAKSAQETRVWLNEQEIQVSDDGFFAIGFGRDAKLEHELKWQTQDGQVHSQVLKLQKREYKIQKIDGLPPKMVTPPESVLERIRKDNRDVAAARKLRDERIDFMQAFQWPAKGEISGVYGSQRILNGTPKNPHFGVDVAGPIGHPVYAPADGVVTLFVPDMYYSGGTMIIDHGHGITSTFLHLSKSHVKAGDVVKQGELVAEIGDTGRVTGAHLDWRMNWLDQRIDPALIVPAKAE